MTIERIIGSWEPWFAWRPVRLADGHWVWGRRIERRQNSILMFGSNGLTTVTLNWYRASPDKGTTDG